MDGSPPAAAPAPRGPAAGPPSRPRGTDRLQRLSRLLAVLVALAAVPLGTSAGGAAAERMTAAAQEHAAAHLQRPAVLLERATGPATTVGGYGRAPATWRVGAGPAREGVVFAPLGSAAGETVPVWMDLAGDPVVPPAGTRDIAGQAVLQGILVGVGLLAAAVVGHHGVCLLLDRVRMVQWGAEWAAVEPHWSDRV